MKTKLLVGRRNGLEVWWPLVRLADGTWLRGEFLSEFGARAWLARHKR